MVGQRLLSGLKGGLVTAGGQTVCGLDLAWQQSERLLLGHKGLQVVELRSVWVPQVILP